MNDIEKAKCMHQSVNEGASAHIGDIREWKEKTGELKPCPVLCAPSHSFVSKAQSRYRKSDRKMHWPSTEQFCASSGFGHQPLTSTHSVNCAFEHVFKHAQITNHMHSARTHIHARSHTSFEAIQQINFSCWKWKVWQFWWHKVSLEYDLWYPWLCHAVACICMPCKCF